MDKCPIIDVPLPMSQRSPIRTTGLVTMSCPGPIPADKVTSAAISTSSPIHIHFSPKPEPVGHEMLEPLPNFPNRFERISFGPITAKRVKNSEVVLITPPSIGRIKAESEDIKRLYLKTIQCHTVIH